MQISQANTKKIFTNFFCRAGKVTFWIPRAAPRRPRSTLPELREWPFSLPSLLKFLAGGKQGTQKRTRNQKRNQKHDSLAHFPKSSKTMAFSMAPWIANWCLHFLERCKPRRNGFISCCRGHGLSSINLLGSHWREGSSLGGHSLETSFPKSQNPHPETKCRHMGHTNSWLWINVQLFPRCLCFLDFERRLPNYHNTQSPIKLWHRVACQCVACEAKCSSCLALLICIWAPSWVSFGHKNWHGGALGEWRIAAATFDPSPAPVRHNISGPVSRRISMHH